MRLRAAVEAMLAPLTRRLEQLRLERGSCPDAAPPGTDLPRSAADPEPPAPVTAPAATAITPAEFDVAARALAGGDAAPLQALGVRFGGTGRSQARLAEIVLAGVARRLGTLWEEDEVSFGAVGAAVHQMMALLEADTDPATLPRTRDGAPAVLLTSAPDETHLFGLSVVAAAFAEAGWTVVSMPRATRAAILDTLSSGWIDVLAITVSWTDLAGEIARLVPLARAASLNRELKVLTGGGALDRNPELCAALGADGAAGGVVEALALATSWAGPGSGAPGGAPARE